MKKNYRNKMVSDSENKEPSRRLICIRECEMPGVGFWKSGDIVVDENKISQIGDNPCFEEIKEEKQ